MSEIKKSFEEIYQDAVDRVKPDPKRVLANHIDDVIFGNGSSRVSRMFYLLSSEEAIKKYGADKPVALFGASKNSYLLKFESLSMVGEGVLALYFEKNFEDKEIDESLTKLESMGISIDEINASDNDIPDDMVKYEIRYHLK